MKVRGYVFSRSFMGERAPQHVQNIVIKNFCDKSKYTFLLSSTEYAFKNSFLILDQMMNEIDQIDGIIAYSLFQLPYNDIIRRKYYEKMINKSKAFIFAVEGMKLSKISDIERIENIWNIKKILPKCIKNIKN